MRPRQKATSSGDGGRAVSGLLRRDKVFGIGLGKTGTTSLAVAMKLLGYRAKHGPRTIDDIEAYEFSNDIGVSWRYRFLHHVYPRAKFILTVRDTEAWLRSCDEHARKVGRRVALRRLENRFMCFGRTDYEREHFRAVYEAHNVAVRAYFATFPGTLLELRICDGEGWEKLCPFLRAPLPDVPFPYANRTSRADYRADLTSEEAAVAKS